jgi:1,4-alpha-glucan branching enzyme
LHGGLQNLVRDLNRLYREESALHEWDCKPEGFEWIEANDPNQSVLAFARRGSRAGAWMLVLLNFTPVVRHNYRIGVPESGYWAEVLNTDAPIYGGSGHGNLGGVESTPVPYHGRLSSLNVTLPPLGALFLKYQPA